MHALQEMILENCYDRTAHPIAAILLQCFGVPQPAINVLLEMMETMQFFLHTRFGELATSYGGTHKERLAGFGQGNAAAGPGFTYEFAYCESISLQWLWRTD
jgi:hypothetical protein